MFADLLSNQVRNGLKQALTPIYDEVTAALKGGLSSVKITLAGMQESVGLMLSQAYGLLSIIGGMGKKSQGGSIIGAILGGVIGSVIPGLGTAVGVSLGAGLGGAIASGNPAGLLAAGLGAYGTISAAGAAASSTAFAATGGIGSGNALAAFGGNASLGGGAIGSKAERIAGSGHGEFGGDVNINVTTGNVNNAADLSRCKPV